MASSPQIGDSVLDGSVRTRLNQLREAYKMAELTINTADITAAIKKNLEGFALTSS